MACYPNNCSGYERLETLQRVNEIIDIYMPDIKYADAEIARKYSRISDYPRVAKAALREMHRQVGDLTLDKRGVPGGLAGTAELMEFIAIEVSPTRWINIMDQYYPTYLAYRYPELKRKLAPAEFREAVAAASKASPAFHLL